MNCKKYFVPDSTFWCVARSGEKFSTPGRWLTSLFHNSPLHWWLRAIVPDRGTKSILFGVHQFLWHPWTVARAWRHLYGQWPAWRQWVAIFCHDIGYWGKPNMDGPAGRTHPVAGADLACDIVYFIGRIVYRRRGDAALDAESARELCLWHSTHYAELEGAAVSELYLPDKVSVLYDPVWFYLLRGSLSGEINEYYHRENHKRWMHGEEMFRSKREWLVWYRNHIREKARKTLVDAANIYLNCGDVQGASAYLKRAQTVPSA